MQRQRQERQSREETILRQRQEDAMRRRQDEMRLAQDMHRRGGDDMNSGNRGDQVGASHNWKKLVKICIRMFIFFKFL